MEVTIILFNLREILNVLPIYITTSLTSRYLGVPHNIVSEFFPTREIDTGEERFSGEQ